MLAFPPHFISAVLSTVANKSDGSFLKQPKASNVSNSNKRQDIKSYRCYAKKDEDYSIVCEVK